SAGSGNVITNNVITDNKEGVFSGGGSLNNTITHNEIGRNGVGVEIECSGGNTVYWNHVGGNSSTGIIIRRLNANRNVLDSNTITNNGGDGVRVYDQAANTRLYNNYISHNGGDGVLVFTNALNTTVTNNTITFNGGNGVHVAGAGTLGVAIVG